MRLALAAGAVSNDRRAAGALPAPDIVVTMKDYTWTFSRPITAGRHVLRITNAGAAIHELKFRRVLPGFTTAESIAWTPASGAPPADVDLASVTAVKPGVSVITTIDLPPGDYTLWCVLQRKHGMVQSLHVAELGRR